MTTTTYMWRSTCTLSPHNILFLRATTLGGAVAQIVVAHTDGVLASHLAFPGSISCGRGCRLTLTPLTAFITNVIVLNDFTLDFDTPGGTVHRILCEHQTAEVCHSIQLHVIRMWAVCTPYLARTVINGTYTLTG
ncbi:hypothetical protein TraAM80_06214 [Trypanosoma rangeli]|uniref:Uncharacterized protein n=1 Tax=Trypanosoma rangeli TaxID=5698 RepID=A0A422NB77_TRYRA|nr:uncharacterized protein TraAM80_06214 [Trypanosoma rangeli]RNF02692.1 hypothetical protein TraAM80_06214 [Trypanosoma rangeli]|eukprot:RNF02692.1 hypothetical protein TraAM80_06214 [Trypanosoma rangeli]